MGTGRWRWTQALRSTSRSRSTCRRWSPPCAEPSAKTHPPARYRSPDDAALAALGAALGFLQLRPRAPELQLLHRWLDTWAGIGLIAVGLHRQGWDLLLTQYGAGNWRATFYVPARRTPSLGARRGSPRHGARCRRRRGRR